VIDSAIHNLELDCQIKMTYHECLVLAFVQCLLIGFLFSIV
jgi:hypothetical protein